MSVQPADEQDRRKDGVAFPACLSISGVSDADGRVIHRSIVFSDLTEDRKRERHIRRLDHHDGLTDLPNRTLMLDRLKMALAAAERENGVVAVVDNLLRTVAQPIVLGDHRLSVTPSIGIALYPDNHGEAEGLIHCADAAMYHAKELGRNNHQYFTPAMNTRAQERLALEAAMRNGIVRGEFSLHYQPQVRIEDGALAGVEALLRWHHPEMGAVSPARFIPVAEETGKIVAIGDWVLREACRQGRAWHDAGFTRLQVAVNLSPRQFRQANFCATC